MAALTDLTEKNLDITKQVLTDNHDFLVKHLEADDVIDELIQERIVGRSAAQRVQLPTMTREYKNRIICDQLSTAGPGAMEKFSMILRKGQRQSFIAERLEKSLLMYGEQNSASVINMSEPPIFNMPITPPPTCQKQKFPEESSRKNHTMPCLTAIEWTAQKTLIDNFVKDHVVVELDPNSYPHFARCLGLNDNYTHNEHHQSTTGRLYQIMHRWFYEQESHANINSFYSALEMHKGLQEKFFFYCKEPLFSL